MASNISDNHNESKASARRRIAVIASAVACIIVIAAALGLYLTHRGNGSDQASGQPGNQSATTQNNGSATPSNGDSDNPSNDVSAEQDNSSLPFSFKGADAPTTVIDASQQATDATLSGAWTFGGDYSVIGSIPIDANTAFGSSTNTPDDITSYVAAMISADGTKPLEQKQARTSGAYEPQDGTGNAQRVVWRSSTINGSAQTLYDNWRIQTWSADGGTVTLATAKDLNQREDTPTVDSDIVPTFNEDNAFFASNIIKDGSWKTKIVQMRLDGKNTEAIADGSYPAAVPDGVLYASDARSLGDDKVAYQSLNQYSSKTGKSNTVFSISGKDHSWGITGVWASSSYRAIAMTDLQTNTESYIGVWNSDFSKPVAWLHVATPTVVASLNDDWLVWGAGSQADNADIYAFRFDQQTVKKLGSAPGYSRPAIAMDNDTVMLPVVKDQSSPVSYTIAQLQ
ncbi:hypothetical protein [Bifidobacterium sp. SO1]|uniref:hypothetical protein n=1 Tax=Bifidobacterium sp. SO1 TaxID=2809029 RepID=UPI001BDC16C1|nr:hypothetical protein [Bifidobacterium sp. SO1]MBT1161475.1 hypothetical protein [Bifidobacterium sp. SO1]